MMGRRLFLFLVLLAGFSVSGCKQLEVRDRWFDSDRVAALPTEIMPIWTDTVLPPTRQTGHAWVRRTIVFLRRGQTGSSSC